MQPMLKYCGNRSLEDVQAAATSKADYLGFVFAKSKRQVTVNEVTRWLDQVNVNGKKLVALFVNEPIDQIVNVVKQGPFDVIQCHGTENRDYIMTLKERIDLPVWKAIHHSGQGLQMMRALEGVVEAFVVDAKVEGQWGGTGQSFDWHVVPLYLQEGKRQQVPVFIAGGINPHNVELLLPYGPCGIDISSGIEENGQKSSAKICQIEKKVLGDDSHISR
ncbi:phosphoribosylanthranilate isomerase [Halalkalibacterium halodurans]|uniref:N-(5'-phosphoribosyl)anthranilate isomerase n=1 Tax=Halalkalibacterium halodurans (strain ATCC BAA-125 / DSM 18197 / FERM 7344 / JCM 9153 / C-125) TaxID=272558 RepID=TRPF_HALH5|nr:phosphoribosylanthranilate isomerase [Halalkalibacterium halodurans]Q9KCB1.1 RecName: Full=N-(5'-phosphoribosyl)anthranilate isomerase; Short=PRAI [Halalkalibacterium halodurans C-125]MED4081361.1 phosphoribosylanthranilate isomerase [Halalkalibacterium halodurans]MED4086900.1 phosphoribosylanthranilate isomerase [Halalkalibacterium halodurans]MED4104325.1 phosphoribosylanthranilate isomerase [Halalkalibacterium halodurans]MED4109212.1 phosphoribosylanthranilate isomerase [Halalkalibacteriu